MKETKTTNEEMTISGQMRAWTPGPWHVAPLTKAWGVYESDGTAVARVGGAYGVAFERREADARLIAASPDLYEAVAELLREFVDPEQSLEQFDSCVVRKTVERARAALAKARGE